MGAAAVLLLAACSNESQRLTSPSLPPLRFDVQGQDLEGTDAVVCVSNSSPAGNYTFTVTNVTPGSGGSTVTGPNPAIVGRGTCFTLVSRLLPEDDANPDADPPTSVTYSYTSSDVAGGAAHTGTICVNDPGIPASSPCGATVTAYVNFVAGSVATFSFVSSVQLIEALRTILSNLDLSKAIEHELDDRLRDASKSAAKGHNSNACNQVDQFIKRVNQRSKKDKIGSADATNLLAAAEEIQISLGC